MKKKKLIKRYDLIFFSVFFLLLFIVFFEANLRPLTFDRNKTYSVVVPHGDYAKDMRESLFNEIKPNINPETIILLSPDHYSASTNSFTTADQTWTTDSGNISANTEIIDKLNIPINNEIFYNEHGIKNLLFNIKSTFGQAKLIPIILNQDISQPDTETLYNNLKQNCSSCLVIASVDFSHYNPLSIAKLHDDYTINALQELNQSNVWKAEVDSNASLYIATKWADLHRAKSFRVVSHQNSLDNTVDKSVESTSFVTGYFTNYHNASATVSGTTFSMGGTWQGTDTSIMDLQQTLGQRVFWGTDLASVSYPTAKTTLLDQYLKINHSVSINDLKSPEINKINSPEPLVRISINLDNSTLDSLAQIIKQNSKHKPYIIVSAFRASGTSSKDLEDVINAGANFAIGNQLNTNPLLTYYQDKPIINTLGNLDITNKVGLIITGKVTETELHLVFSPINIDRNSPKLSTGSQKNALLDQIITDKRCSLSNQNNDTIIVSRN